MNLGVAVGLAARILKVHCESIPVRSTQAFHLLCYPMRLKRLRIALHEDSEKRDTAVHSNALQSHLTDGEGLEISHTYELLVGACRT